MAVSITNLTASGSTTGAASYDTASISPSANTLIIVSVGNKRTGISSSSIPTISGAGMTWVQIDSGLTAGGGTVDRHTTFRGLSATPGSGAITIDFGGNTQDNCQWIIDQFDGVDTSGTNGSGAITQYTFNGNSGIQTDLTATLAAFASTANATYGSLRWSAGGTVTPGSGFAETVEAIFSAAVQSEFRVDNDTTVDWSWSSDTGRSNGFGFEITALVATTTSTSTSVSTSSTSTSSTSKSTSSTSKSTSSTSKSTSSTSRSTSTSLSTSRSISTSSTSKSTSTSSTSRSTSTTISTSSTSTSISISTSSTSTSISTSFSTSSTSTSMSTSISISTSSTSTSTSASTSSSTSTTIITADLPVGPGVRSNAPRFHIGRYR